MQIFILIYFSLIVKQAISAYVNHARIRSWNQPLLSNVSCVNLCSRKQREPLMGLGELWQASTDYKWDMLPTAPWWP